MEITFDSLFKDIFDTTSDLIHFLTPDGNIEIVNPSWLERLGYSVDEVFGLPIDAFIFSEDLDTYNSVRQHVLQGGLLSKVFEFAMVHKSGKLVYVEGQIGKVLINGVIKYTRAIIRDITHQKEKEKSFLNNQRKFSQFFEFAPDAVIVINSKQEITEWNIKAEKIFGYSAAEALGKFLAETIIPLKHRKAHNFGMEHFLKTGEGPVLNTTIEITALHKNGKEFDISLSISNIKIDDEWLFISFISDITEKKKIQRELIYKEAELVQSKLLDDRKNNFLSYASHELKTPLTSMKGYLQIIERVIKRGGDVDIGDFLKKANLQASKLTDLVNDLLDIAKIESGRVTYNYSEINFSEIINDSVFFANNLGTSHTIKVEGDSDFMVYADKSRIEQVITNLLSNAIKYSPQSNSVIIKVSHTEFQLQVAVTDFGIGIPEENLELLFERFYRVDENSIEFSGLGLGLYIAHQIIKRHDGKIWIASKLGKGSTFSFTIPLKGKSE